MEGRKEVRKVSSELFDGNGDDTIIPHQGKRDGIIRWDCTMVPVA